MPGTIDGVNSVWIPRKNVAVRTSVTPCRPCRHPPLLQGLDEDNQESDMAQKKCW